MPTPSTTLGQLPALAAHAHFASRPSLVSVVFAGLRQRILEHYPTLPMDLTQLKLASPLATGGHSMQLLLNVAIDHLLNPQLLDFEPRNGQSFFLTQTPPEILAPAAPAALDMQVIAHVIDDLRLEFCIDFQQALADYWNATDSHGNSRWQWLAELLNGQMIAAVTATSALNEVQLDMLTTVAQWPQLLTRLRRSDPPTYVYFIETTLTKGAERVTLLTPDMIIVRDRQVLLCAVDGAVQAFDDMDAFGRAWGAKLAERFQFDTLTWRRNEPDGNVFEQQAGLILNQQLEDIAHLSFEGHSEETLEARLAALTDPAQLLSRDPKAALDVLQKVDRQLPAWLQQADAEDRFAYHRHAQDMAQVMKQNQGRSFNEGIQNVQRFSREALRAQMKADHGDFDPDALVLDFTVAAGYPGGAGIIEHVRMSLTELAVKNLAGKPSGTVKLSAKNGETLPQWLTEDYLMGSGGLIQRVDIGTTYPQAIKDLLLSDSREAQERETLFCRELRVHLPMQALEFKIRRLYGVTTQGYRYIKALMGIYPADRLVDDQQIVLRPLALCRAPHTTPDPVSNMFIIESRTADSGPHLLYRPLYSDCLYEFPTRQALLDAIAQPGALQDSVLTWLTDKARRIYAYGGIREPHILRFLVGEDTVTHERPAPATLARDEGADEWLQSQLNGQLLNHLFGSTARALVDLADRESVSNGESRWAIVMQGAWLLFNTLVLPLVRGPAMLAGWFLVMVSSLEQDLSGLDSTDATTRELALIDLLLNTAMVLLHAASSSPSAPKPLPERVEDDTAQHLDTWRHPLGVPRRPSTPIVRQGAVALPGEVPLSGPTALDFSRSLASPKASALLLEKLLDIHVPWPPSLPAPQAGGPLKGLYRIGNQWHASVGGLLFQVAVVPGFGEVYLVHPQHPLRPGFKLVSDGQGHWRLDRGAKLEGGMPGGRRAELQRKKSERLQPLIAELKALGIEFLEGDTAAAPAVVALNSARATLKQQRKTLRQVWELLSKAVPELKERFSQRHQEEQQKTARAKVEFDIAYEHYRTLKEAVFPALRRYEAKAVELMEIDKANPDPKHKKDIATWYFFDYWGSLFDVNMEHLLSFNETPRGETYFELSGRVNEELPQGINDAYNEVLALWKAQFETFKQLVVLAEKMESILQPADPAQRKYLLRERPDYAYVSSVEIKQSLLIFLSELVLNRNHRSREPAEHPFVMELADPNRDRVILSHAEIRDIGGYSPAEQMNVLKNVLELYERLENAVTSLAEMGSGFVREDYRAAFMEHLTEARNGLETQLADLILVDAGFAPVEAPPKAARTKSPGKIVFKTRNNEYLVGDLQPTGPQTADRFVTIQDPVTKKLVATYHEYPNEGAWHEVVEATPPTPPVARVTHSLQSIENEARTVMARRAKTEFIIRDQQKKLLDHQRREALRPLEWEEMLSPQARQLEALANEIERDHATQPNASTLINTFRDEAQSLRRLAQTVCSEAFKQQRPKAANIEYLWRHGLVDINLVKRRTPLKGGGFLTEYAVRDKQKIRDGKRGDDNVLWYAHFHYAKANTPAFEPAFGHLKTKEERLFTRKELIEQARANHREVVNLEKVVIKPPLDRELFLKLEPAQA
ncbi:dermonecrotic toxin domain-containing protein [Pseudomonas sp. 18175]|uniref:dermonecrotic toxin domain-containing protein n=1 Tax=Pseudomonas sp. 18175 TaxID=3390056 RepID=UPI003D1EE6FE